MTVSVESVSAGGELRTCCRSYLDSLGSETLTRLQYVEQAHIWFLYLRSLRLTERLQDAGVQRADLRAVRVCRRLPCLPSGESSGDDVEAVRGASSVPDGNGFYPDLRIGGVKVDTSVIKEEREQVSFSPSRTEPDSPTYPSSSIRFDSLQDEHLVYGDLDEDVDSLITRKLLEVFSEFEINELAKCTSDSMFPEALSGDQPAHLRHRSGAQHQGAGGRVPAGARDHTHQHAQEQEEAALQTARATEGQRQRHLEEQQEEQQEEQLQLRQ
ncbi:hypothetical protein SRHO_G00015640 [Serrasalmus rhombeus]